MLSYVNNEVDKDQNVVIHLKLRDLYDIREDDDKPFMDNKEHIYQDLAEFFPNDNECMQLIKDNVDNEVDVLTNQDTYMNLD